LGDAFEILRTKIVTIKQTFNQALGARSNKDRIGLCQCLEASGKVGRFANDGIFFNTFATANITGDNQSRGDTNADSQADIGIRNSGVEVPNGLNNAKPGTHSPLDVILMRLGVTEVDKQPVANITGDVPVKVLNHVSTRLLILRQQIAQLLGVELLGKRGGANQVTEHDGKLAAFGFGCFAL